MYQSLIFLLPGLLLSQASIPATSRGNIKAQGVPVENSDVLRNEVTICEKSVTLEDLLKTVKRDTGVDLAVEKDLRNQRVHLNLQRRKVSTIMTILVSLLDGGWTPTSGGFVLHRSVTATAYQRQWWSLYNAERKKALSDTYSLLLDRMSAGKPDFKSLQKIPDFNTREQFANGMFEGQFWSDLPDTLKNKVASAMSYDFAYRRLKGITTSGFDGGVVEPIASFPITCKQSLAHCLNELNPQLDAGDIASVVFISVGFDFEVSAIMSDGSGAGVGLGMQGLNGELIPAFSVDHRDLPGIAARPGVVVPRPWRKLIEYQKNTVWKNAVGKGVVAKAVTPRLSDVLDALARARKIEFVADYYSLPQSPLDEKEKKYKWNRPLADELDKIATDYDISWKQLDSGVVLIRNNRWYRDDRLEAPESAVKCLRAFIEYTGQHAPAMPSADAMATYAQMESGAFIVSNFDLWQIANGLYFYTDEAKVPPLADQSPESLLASNCQPFSDIAQVAFTYRRTCLFYASLTADQRVLLLTKGISEKDLTSEQRQLLLVAAPQASGAGDVSRAVRLSFSRNRTRFRQNFIFGNQNYGLTPYKVRLRRGATENP